MPRTSSKKLSPFTLTNSVFLAGKAGASCALALIAVEFLSIPDKVTASFVAFLCCAPAALMGLRVSYEQFAGSLFGGVFGTLALYAGLPLEAGVPLAVTSTILCTQGIGFYRGTVAGAFTALFVQIVTFETPLHTFEYRIYAVLIAGASALLVNILVSACFYESLFRRRLTKLRNRVNELLQRCSTEGPIGMHPLFGLCSQLNEEMMQATVELNWRRSHQMAAVLTSMRRELLWMRDFVHLVVDFEFSQVDSNRAQVQAFLGWLVHTEGAPPPVSGPLASATRDRILEHLEKDCRTQL